MDIILAIVGIVLTVTIPLYLARRNKGSRLRNTETSELASATLQAYNRSLANECRHLPLGTIAAEFVRPIEAERIPLPDVYVELELRSVHNQSQAQTPDPLAQTQFPVRHVLNGAERHHVVTGDAGSGKTTIINYLTYILTTNKATDDALVGLHPLRIVLREVAAKLDPDNPQPGRASLLWDAVREDIVSRCGKTAAEAAFPLLQQRVLREGALVLLDGLDEVPEARKYRRRIIDAIKDLASSLSETRSRFLVTARPYAYAEPAWHLPLFSTWSIQPLGKEQIQSFLDLWYAAARSSFGWGVTTSEARASALLQAIRDKAYLHDLAVRPLLLTLMAALHSNWGRLPEDRASLYEEAVQLLLGRWQRARDAYSPDGERVVEKGITEALNIGEERLRPALEQLAFNAHKAQQSSDRSISPAEIRRGDLMEVFEPLLGDIEVRNLLTYLQHRAGLLIERKENLYSFPHRSFQEYLAACHLAEDPNFFDILLDLLTDDQDWWREVFLLAVGRVRRGSLAHAAALISLLLPRYSANDKSPTNEEWLRISLAGESLVDLRLAERFPNHRVYENLTSTTRQWLQKLLETGALESGERAKSGEVLARLGDQRRGVGLVRTSDRTLPDILWVQIPAGDFGMGGRSDDMIATNHERPFHRVFLKEYYISMYPITNLQYSLFLKAGGYDRQEYWCDLGWSWLHGREVDLSPIRDPILRDRYVRWMKERPKRKTEPRWWRDGRYGLENAPVVGINWYEAKAYAMWLTDISDRNSTGIFLPTIKGRFSICLPTEAQWEKAARGTCGFLFPWGDDDQPGFANTKEEGIGQPTAVGSFPNGLSPYGVADMCGNVWEWTQTRWGYSSHLKPDYSYPYIPDDGREDESGPFLRAVRGSSWFGNRENFGRCSYRGWGFAFNVSQFSGFRVALTQKPAHQ